MFGRSIYCNYDKSYYFGYTYSLDRHTKGILVKDNIIHQEGYFNEGLLEQENNYPIVDLMYDRNEKFKEM